MCQFISIPTLMDMQIFHLTKLQLVVHCVYPPPNICVSRKPSWLLVIIKERLKRETPRDGAGWTLIKLEKYLIGSLLKDGSLILHLEDRLGQSRALHLRFIIFKSATHEKASYRDIIMKSKAQKDEVVMIIELDFKLNNII